MADYLYHIVVSHDGLNKYKVVKATTKWEAQQKADALKAQWDEQWTKKLKIKNDEEAMSYAAEQTRDLEKTQNEMDTILTGTLVPPKFDFKKLKDYSKFEKRKPKEPVYAELPREPQREDVLYNEKPTFFVKLLKKRLEAFEASNAKLFNDAHDEWEKRANWINETNTKLKSDYENAVDAWEKEKEAFQNEQNRKNSEIDEFEKKFNEGEKEAIERFFSLVLDNIYIPFEYNRDVETEYYPNEKQLIVEIYLPVQEDIPNRKSVSYVKTKGEFKEAVFSESYIKKKYDSVIYQIVLQILNYCFNLNGVDRLVESVALNGRIRTVDKTTGKDIEPCILSVATKREEFRELNLSAIDPKAWFKSSKGVSAASLATVTPIAPIVEMSREDKRFVDAYAVADGISEGDNIAAMDWQDFENLIRELFEKEFNINGGEVKITQASRDGGVDAIAFDPDPIRGGKIVIQAKRYTNVVGVSAVRDLYGTVLNEGATKGILVTTSNYGNDAYSFANGKPITLMNGANLLYLMEKHGYKAKIDIKEAKKILKEEI